MQELLRQRGDLVGLYEMEYEALRLLSKRSLLILINFDSAHIKDLYTIAVTVYRKSCNYTNFSLSLFSNINLQLVSEKADTPLLFIHQ
jgi:hypothetical protein